MQRQFRETASRMSLQSTHFTDMKKKRKKKTHPAYYVCHENEEIIFLTEETDDCFAELVQDVDGHYYFWMCGSQGSLPVWVLERIVEKMNELNPTE
jgi:hypothetical protein